MTQQPFHQRFNIPVALEQAQTRFVNRVHNEIWTSFLHKFRDNDRFEVESRVLTILGCEQDHLPFPRQIGKEFWANVRALDAMHSALTAGPAASLSQRIEAVLSLAEVDLGIRWHEGRFLPSGSTYLDEHLVNDVLGCLAHQPYEGVRKAFNKGLDLFLHSLHKPVLLADVITDMYEALEGLAKITTGKDRDLSSNAELFLKGIQVSDLYKPILKEYLVYGNKIRHAGKDGQPKPDLTRKEVESFMYQTGMFIRLAVITEAEA